MASDELEKLASAIERRTADDGGFETAVPTLRLSRFSAPSDLTALVYEPSLCLVAHGAKEVLLADEAYRLDPAKSLLVSVDLPVAARVIEASPRRPYLAVRIALDTAVVGELLADGLTDPVIGLPAPRPRGHSGRRPSARRGDPSRESPRFSTGCWAARTARASRDHLPAAHRSSGSPPAQIVSAGAPAQRIARAIRWLKDHFADPLRVESLARHVRMSPSAFHLHFKAVTALSPLQYQKRMRLQEARRLMLGDGLDAAEAAFRVGYESPSQFSREYRRLFGAPPRQDVSALRVEAQPVH